MNNRRKRLGDKIESALSRIGITDEKVSQWLGRPCGCRKRKMRLNQLDELAEMVMRGEFKAARDKLEDMMK